MVKTMMCAGGSIRHSLPPSPPPPSLASICASRLSKWNSKTCTQNMTHILLHKKHSLVVCQDLMGSRQAACSPPQVQAFASGPRPRSRFSPSPSAIVMHATLVPPLSSSTERTKTLSIHTKTEARDLIKHSTRHEALSQSILFGNIPISS